MAGAGLASCVPAATAAAAPWGLLGVGSANSRQSKPYPYPAHKHHCPSPSLSLSSCARVADYLPVSAAPSTQWPEFAKRVSGEWDGFGAEFGGDDGRPLHLPESVVPEAYREWEVELFDWQTQCPTLAHPDSLLLSYSTIRLLPTVGCEADAATRHSVVHRTLRPSNPDLSALAYHSTGSYVAVWPAPPLHLELEHCLFSPLDPESRVRVVQVVAAAPSSCLSLLRVHVFREQWYGPFRNGDQLGGCAIRDSAFASTPPLDASLVLGAWQGPCSVARFPPNSLFQELADGGIRRSLRDARGLVLLPKQIWCSVQGSEGGETCCEVGWLFDRRSAVTSRCILTVDAKLKEISVAQETAMPEAAA